MNRSIRLTLVSALSMTPGLGLLVAMLAAMSYIAGLIALSASSFLPEALRIVVALATFLCVLLGSALLCGRGAGRVVGMTLWADDTRQSTLSRAFGRGWTVMVGFELAIGCGIPGIWEACVGRESQSVILLSLVVGAFVGAAWAGRVAAQAFEGARDWHWTVASAHLLSCAMVMAAAATASVAPGGWLMFLLVPFAYALPIAWRIESSRVEA